MVKKVEKGKKTAIVNRGAWTAEEDQKLVEYVRVHGDKKWRTLPVKAGLNRCGKSCRLRWLNYLRPGIKRGNISEDEEDLIIRLHNLLGNRWSLIAGRLPGRTDNEIKNHWNTHLSKRSLTINDLNLKLKPKLEGGNVTSPRECTPDLTTTGPGDCGDAWLSDMNSEPINSSAEVSGVGFDIEQLFDFMSMPDPNQNDAGSSSNDQQLVVEDYGVVGHEDIYDLSGIDDQGCLASLPMSYPSEFCTTMDQFVGCQDYAFYFLD